MVGRFSWEKLVPREKSGEAVVNQSGQYGVDKFYAHSTFQVQAKLPP